MRFKDLKLATKQIVVFGIIIIIMAFVGAFSLAKIAHLKQDIDEVSNNWLPRAIAISDININTSDLRAHQLQYIQSQDLAQREKLKKIIISLIDRINENQNTFDELMERYYDKKIDKETEKQLYEFYKDKWDDYQGFSIQFFFLSRENKNQEAVELLNGPAQEVFNEIGNLLQQLVLLNKNESIAATLRAEKAFHATKGNTLFLFTITIIISILSISTLVRYITKPVLHLEKAAKEVASGNLDVCVDIQRKDEVGNLSRSFNKMTDSLRASKERTEKQAKALHDQAMMLKVANDDLAENNLQLESTLGKLRNTQEQLLLKEKMASLGDLVAGVAHEINNPIGTITSSIDVSERCITKIEDIFNNGRSLTEENRNEIIADTLRLLKTNINVTMLAGHRIAKIVKSLKNFSHVDESLYQKIDIHEGIDSTLTLIEGEFRGRITIQKEYGQLPKIKCYPNQLNQVFMNLLKNSIIAIEGEGSIGIKTSKGNNHIQVEIYDSGRGIPNEKLNHIFEFGFSVNATRVKMSSGLSTVYNIIQKHNGDIWVESEVGKGTTFFIKLPIN